MDTEHIEIIVENQSSRFQVQPEKIREIASLALGVFAFRSYQLGITFVDEQAIRELNREYRGQDKATDVLSFPQLDWQSPVRSDLKNPEGPLACMAEPPLSGVPLCLGDIVIAPEKARENAESLNQSLAREVCFLVIHGLLHLLGHDHEEEEEERVMLSEQNKIMEMLQGKDGKPSRWEQIVSEARKDS